MKARLLLVPWIACLLCVGSIGAEEMLSPETLVTLYYQEMAKGDWNAVSQHMHTGELEKFKTMMLPVFEEGFRSEKQPDALAAFTQGDDLEKVRNYTPQEFFSRFLKWIMVMKPGTERVLQHSTVQPIGHVMEEQSVHVVYRMNTEIEGMKISKLAVMSLKPQGAQLKLALTGEIEGMAQALQSQLRSR